jgi:hypothetical protein
MIFWDLPFGYDATRFVSEQPTHDAPSWKASSSCGDVEHGICRIGRQLTVRDSIQNNLESGRLNPLNRVLLGVLIKEDIQFRYFGNPTAIDFPVEFDGKLHDP